MSRKSSSTAQQSRKSLENAKGHTTTARGRAFAGPGSEISEYETIQSYSSRYAARLEWQCKAESGASFLLPKGGVVVSSPSTQSFRDCGIPIVTYSDSRRSAMEFTLTFGAVGDFIAVIEIVRNIIVALDDYRGSAKEYRVVVQSLEILEKTLQLVADLYNDQSPASGLSDLKAIVLRNVEQIRLCLQAFSEKIQKFAPSLSPGGTKNVLKDVARKIQWKLEENDVEKFRAEIVAYTISLDVLLEVTTARVVQRNHETSIQQVTDTENRTALRIRNSNQSLKGYFGVIGRRILSRLEFVSRLGMELKSSTSQLISMILTISAELSSIRTVIMRLERPISEEFFTFEDATGKTFPIHLRTITSWEAFEYIIADRFKGRKGAHRTQRKQYSLQERASSRAIDRSLNWEIAFLPYQKVDMSLICREADKTALNKSSPSCPRCSTVSPGETGVEVQCSNCGMFFTRVVEGDEEDLPDAPSPPRLNREARFGESGFYTATAGGAAKRPREDEDSEKEQSFKGGKPKRRREQESRKRKATNEEPESDSDDEDVRGFVRITLISKRKRVHHHHPISPFYADQIESFDSVAQRTLGNKPGLSIITSPFDPASIPSSSFGSMSVHTKLQLSGAAFQTSRDNPLGEDEDEEAWADSNHDEVNEFGKAVADKAEEVDSELTSPNATNDDNPILQAAGAAQSSNTQVNTTPALSLEKSQTYTSPYENAPPEEYYYARERFETSPPSPRTGSYYYSPTADTRYTSDGLYATSQGGFSYVDRDAADVFPRRPPSPATVRPLSSRRESLQPPRHPRQATLADANRHGIPLGYSLKHWDPSEEPVLLLGSVFDSNSIGKWIFDWSTLHYGPASPMSDMAGELWLLLVDVAGRIRRAEEVCYRITVAKDVEILDDFVDTGERLIDKFRELLKTCEAPMLKARKKDSSLGNDAGIEFIETLFGFGRELEKTERVMQGFRLFKLRFDANCDEILRKLTKKEDEAVIKDLV